MAPPQKPNPFNAWMEHPLLNVPVSKFPPAPVQGNAGGTGTNPFDAPEAQVQIEKYALPAIQQLAVQQAQNAARDFATAITKVKAAKKEEADAAQANQDMMWSIAISIALMPAGPIVEAAAIKIAGPKLQSEMLKAIVNNAGALEAKFGAKGAQVANKSFDVIASEAITKMANKFDSSKAASALNAGVDLLKGQMVKFAASSDAAKCVGNFLDAVLKQANDSMHNLTDYIQTTSSYSEAIAYYNYFSKPLQGIYEAVLAQQADDMLKEVADVIADRAKTGLSSILPKERTDEIVKIQAYGRTLFAHVTHEAKTMGQKGVSPKDPYYFVKWVTPDMEPMAEKLMTKEISPKDIEGHIPDPQREPGERVVLVDGWGRERLLLIQIEDQGIYWKDYGVRTFKKWAEGDEEAKAFRSRGALQIGGIEKIDLSTVKGLKEPPKA
jgi:hypothetical protein